MSYFPSKPQSVFSTINFTTAALADGASYTGTYESNDYPDLLVSVVANVDLEYYVDLSSNGVTADVSVPYEVRGGGINYPHRLTVGPRYVRLRIENNSGKNATFTSGNLQFGQFNDLAIGQHRIAAQDNDATVTRPTNFRIETALGLRDGIQVWTAFGSNTDLDAGVSEMLSTWGPTNFDPKTDIVHTAQTLTITYNQATDGAGQLGATSLLFDYLAADGTLASTTHVLGSSGSDVTAFTALGVNLVRVVDTGSSAFNVSGITVTATTDTTVQAQVEAGKSVSHALLLHLPTSASLLLDELDLEALKLSGGGAPKIEFTVYAYSRDLGVQYQLLRSEMDTAAQNNIHIDFPNPLRIPAYNVLYVTGESDTNNTVVKGRASGVLHRE